MKKPIHSNFQFNKFVWILLVVAGFSGAAFEATSLSITAQARTQIDITGPVGSGSFGTTVAMLPNGNIVVTDPTYDITTPILVTDVGAVYLYDGKSFGLISRVTGNCQNDNVGSGGIKVLSNGSFLISSPNWDLVTVNGTQTNYCVNGSQLVAQDAGAVTAGNRAPGSSGVVTSANSLFGSNSNDRVGNSGILVLSNGNYIVKSPFWGNNRGAVTFGNSNNLLAAQVSESNSLIGLNSNDYIGNVTVLTNGNYLVNSSSWNVNRGSVTLCSGMAGCMGSISSSNSLVGSPGDSISFDGVTVLSNGNYVVRSRFWNGQRGAVTFGNGVTGVVGLVSSSNSLVGNTVNDFVGSGDGFLSSGITALSNGNYVVISSNWDNGAMTNVGAATFGNGTTGVSGFISPANSLVGSRDGDFYITRVTALSNGNYVVFLPRWNAPPGTPGGAAVFGNGTTGVIGNISISNSLTNVSESGGVTALTNGNYVVATPGWNSTRGAATFGNGVTGTFGTVSSANSLVGSNQYDRIGENGVTALYNGNYVVNSSGWNGQRGASTFCSGTVGCGGTVSQTNSLTGSNPFDRAGSGAIALTNGSYVVRSFYWNNRQGAATFGNGTTGIVGSVGSSNSLIGSNANDSIGDLGIIPFPNGNYIVVSRGWNEARGAVTWGSGEVGISGEVTAANSLVGSISGDQVGFIGNTNHGVKAFDDGSYAISSDFWNNGAAVGAGAITLGKRNAPMVGAISSDNSVRGTAQNGGFRLSFDYNTAEKQLVVGHPNNYFSVFRYTELRTAYDFDGDGKSDVSVFRPENGAWYLQQSANGFTGIQFGTSTDKIVPADYDGDGKTDVAVYRNGTWYLQRSSLGFTGVAFGAADDIPVPADYDGDGKSDIAVFRPSNGIWYLLRSTAGFTGITFGQSEDKPVAADYDGDGKADIAVFRNGTWYIQRSSLGFTGIAFGEATDKPVSADYDGDGKTDVAVFRPSNGTWYLQRSQLGFTGIAFGLGTDLSVPADYNGDGKTDVAVFRNGTWYLQRSTQGFMGVAFGAATDKPVPNAFIP